ncbi:uncharacterized protein [Rhodnius prolixus]
MDARFPLLNSCCFLFSLETGAKIIGFFELIGDAALFLYGLISTLKVVINDEAVTESEETLRNVLLTAFVYVDLSFLFELIFAVYLLCGIYKVKPNYIKVWLIVQTVFLVISLFGLLFMVLLYIMLNSDDFNIIEETIVLMLHGYFLLVVYSYYHRLKEANVLLTQV